MARLLNLFTNLFPLWVLLAGGLALWIPPAFLWFKSSYISWALAVIMLGMGVTLSVQDFRQVLSMPRAIATGFFAQFIIMPSLGWAVAKGLRLPPDFAVGLILVGCCPGGTASNVVTYLARANVPLSVLMTMCSTFAAVVMTPLLTKWLAGTYVQVSALGLFLDTVKVVLAPLLAGLALNTFFPNAVKKVLPAAPLVSVVAIVLVVSSILADKARRRAALRRVAAGRGVPAARGRVRAWLGVRVGVRLRRERASHHFHRGGYAELRPGRGPGEK